MLGVGIDEDTAAVIDSESTLRSLGAGAVTILDAHDMRFTDSDAVHRGQPLAMLGVKLDVLTAGCHYDLERRIAFPPPQGTVRLDEPAPAADLESLVPADQEASRGPTLAERTADRGD